ncbi:hypothetical protein [Thalassospira sp.]|uniref:hypothetical protein n=1 Tax=Thalassospira sp. TaxID=1912094 RepID=UPI003AA8B684
MKNMLSISRAIFSPLLNPIVWLIFGGVLLIFLGGYGSGWESSPYIPDGTAEICLKIGSALFGGGVFAVIMKGGQFTNFFVSVVSEVFYGPADVVSLKEAKSRWLTLTGSILKPVLPKECDAAALEIRKKFFDEELKYHFEDVVHQYEINVEDHTSLFTVDYNSTMKVILSPKYKEIIFKQEIESEHDGCELISLIINEQLVSIKGVLSVDPDNRKNKILSFDAKKYSKEGDGGECYLTLERHFRFKQNLLTDPNLIQSLSRYVKGMQVKIRMTSKNGKFVFSDTGFKTFKSPDPYVCPQGWTRCELAEKDQLLLPGQGYILTVIKV